MNEPHRLPYASHSQMLIGAQPPRTAALRVAVIYAVVGAAWILFSDSIVEILLPAETVRAWHVQTIKGWAFIAVGMFLLSGLQLLMMGVIGSYLGRVYVETQDRPLYALAMVARGRDGDHT